MGNAPACEPGGAVSSRAAWCVPQVPGQNVPLVEMDKFLRACPANREEGASACATQRPGVTGHGETRLPGLALRFLKRIHGELNK